MIKTRTPFRISFFGGGTDYPNWYKLYGGAVLGTTINKYCYLSVDYTSLDLGYKTYVRYLQEEFVNDNKDIQHPAVRACLRFMNMDEGMWIYHDSTLPARKGMGTSSAFVVGLLHALYALKEWGCYAKKLARNAIFVEQNMLQEAVGCQDQWLCAVGGFNRLAFNDGEVDVVRLDGSRIEPYLMLFDTGISRRASEIAKEQIAQTPYRYKELSFMKDLVDDAVDVITHGTDPVVFGELLHLTWMEKKRLTDKITTPRIDAIYEAGLNAGAVGGKLLGAGGGGFMLFFVEPDRQEDVKEALTGLTCVPFKFEAEGSVLVGDS